MAYDQRQLRAFLAIAKAGSLGRATETFPLSQPALSRLVHDMENRLGHRLFDRLPRGMVLTDFGQALVPHARRLLFEMDQASEALDTVRGLQKGVIRIGAVATVARGLLPEAVDQLRTSAPGLVVSLVEAPGDRLFQALEDYEIDLAIAGDAPSPGAIERVAECVIDSAFRVFCAVEHPLATKTNVTLTDALAQSWVMFPTGTVDRAFFDNAIRTLGVAPPHIAVETESTSTAISFVDRTPLLGWLPRALFAGAEKVGRLQVLDLPELSRGERFLVYQRRHGMLPLAAQHFIDHLPLKAAG